MASSPAREQPPELLTRLPVNGSDCVGPINDELEEIKQLERKNQDLKEANEMAGSAHHATTRSLESCAWSRA